MTPEYRKLWSRLKTEDTLEMLEEEKYFALSFIKIFLEYYNAMCPSIRELPDTATSNLFNLSLGRPHLILLIWPGLVTD